MRQRAWTIIGTVAVAVSGTAGAAEPAAVRAPVAAKRPATGLRLKTLPTPGDPRLRIDDPRSQLRTGFGGSMVDLFPFEGGKFHLSAGPRLFGRAGRPRNVEPESLNLLPSFRPGGLGGGGGRRRGGTGAMLVGYGRTVDSGLALGVDTGVVMGRMMPPPPGAARMMRFQARSGGPSGQMNEVARATMLYRF